MRQKVTSGQTNRQTQRRGTYLELELQTRKAEGPCPCLFTPSACLLIHWPLPWVGHFPWFLKALPINPFPAGLLRRRVTGPSPY